MSEGESDPRSHPIRVAVLMLFGALIGVFFAPTMGNLLDFWVYTAPISYAIVGATAGLMLFVFCRPVEAQAQTAMSISGIPPGNVSITDESDDADWRPHIAPKKAAWLMLASFLGVWILCWMSGFANSLGR